MKAIFGLLGAGSAMLLMAVTGCGTGNIFHPPPPSPGISIAPSILSLTPGATAQFTPTVTNTSNKTVQWSVMEGAAGGLISATGIYTAPKGIGIYHVVAKTQAAPAAMATATISVATSVARYAIVDLGSAPSMSIGSPSYALWDARYNQFTAVNNMGMVVGANGGDHAFLWSNGVSKDLGTLGGSASAATAINVAGQVVGASTTPSPVPTAVGDGPPHPFLYANGTMQDLGFAGRATAINAAGQIVGYTGDLMDVKHAFLYANGMRTDLGVLPGGQDSVATGINASGQIVGYSTINGARHAFLYSNGAMQDLGLPSGYTQSQALAINDRGQIAGTLVGNSDERLFLYANGAIQNLGSLGSPLSPAAVDAVASINAGGQIVAFLTSGYTTAYSNGTVFLYSAGVLQDLHGLLPQGSSLDPRTVSGINDVGQITGTGYINSNFRTFVMTPQ